MATKPGKHPRRFVILWTGVKRKQKPGNSAGISNNTKYANLTKTYRNYLGLSLLYAYVCYSVNKESRKGDQKDMSVGAKKHPLRRLMKVGKSSVSNQSPKKRPSASGKDIIEKLYGPDLGLREPAQLEEFYRDLERNGQKELSDLLRSK